MEDLFIRKRNGELEIYDGSKIILSITKAYFESDFEVDDIPESIEEEIFAELSDSDDIYDVDDINDVIEIKLMQYGRYEAAKNFILYRDKKDKNRPNKKTYQFLSDDFLRNYKHKDDPFPTELGKFVYYRTYSRPITEEGRREMWWKTVARVVNFSSELELNALKRSGNVIDQSTTNRLTRTAEQIYDMMYNLKLFPSGRSLWVGGTPTSHLFSLGNFNCSFITIDSLKKFSELFFVLMLGVGAGLSVEKKYVNKLPKINANIEIIHKDYQQVAKNDRKEYTELKLKTNTIIEIVIGDSKTGWQKAIEYYFDIISSKQYEDVNMIIINYDNVRPAGERLKTFGGFASGFGAIKQMFEKIDKIFINKRRRNNLQWQTIKPIDCLDIGTIIAENVVAGGVRRSAEIIFCDKDDLDILNAKQNLYYQDGKGNWISNQDILHRTLSNNTVFYHEKPTKEELIHQFDLIRTSGEPAFANMQEMKRRRPDVQGGNPCFEILLKDRTVCNLTEVNLMGFVNGDGSYDKQKMLFAQKLSATMGYRMATIELELHEWNVASKEDMLIGCSLTGVMDFKNATNISDDEFKKLLADLRKVAHDTANELADRVRMNRPKLYTCVKPSGSISQLPTVSSGVHFSHSPYYVRRVRVTANDPLAQAMADAGFIWHAEVGQTLENHNIKVFEFPVKAPEGKTKYDVSAIEQLELYKIIMENYVDHNASNTIHVRPNEWEEVIDWVDANWDSIVGVTFLSLDDSFYQLMPYESITEEQYNTMLDNTPKFNPNILRKFETFEDFDILDAECDAGACPIR